MSSEQQRIELLTRLFGARQTPGVRLGVGDDAAILDASTSELVWTVDASVEGVHFRRDYLSFEDIGYRSMMAATSDLAAMGASPRGALSALILPADFQDSELEALARGQDQAAEAVSMAVLGGNLARGGELSITTTVLGEIERPLLRSGAKPTDIIAVSGPLGLARAGLLSLQRGIASPSLDAARTAWRRPLARMEAGIQAARLANACIDISDGLSLDASRLAKSSSVGILLSEAGLLAHGGPSLIEAARALGEDPLSLALEGGEDYALLISCPEDSLPEGFHAIGRCTERAGLHLERADGSLSPLSAQGFDHFR